MIKDLPFKIHIWDVGHGTSIWIQLPTGENHWIDAGCKEESKWNDEAFYPVQYAREKYQLDKIDLFILSHKDIDHYREITVCPDMFKTILKAVCVNPSFNYSGTTKLKEAFENLHNESNDLSIANVGNVSFNFFTACEDDISRKTGKNNNYSSKDSTENNKSIVVFYRYNDLLFVAPGDIESKGWNSILTYRNNIKVVDDLISNAKHKILVAPHHGRKSNLNCLNDMVNKIKPTLLVITDKFNESDYVAYPLASIKGETVFVQSQRSTQPTTVQLPCLFSPIHGKIEIEYSNTIKITVRPHETCTETDKKSLDKQYQQVKFLTAK